MTNLAVFDPWNWLAKHEFKTLARVYIDEPNVLRQSSPRIAILSFIKPHLLDWAKYDLVIWFGNENFKCFSPALGPIEGDKKHVIVSIDRVPSNNYLCHPAQTYCLAETGPKHWPKPNYNISYTADALIGRIDQSWKINRAWCYYSILERGWKDSIIMPVRRDIDPTEYKTGVKEIDQVIAKYKDIFGNVSPDSVPNWDHLENSAVASQFQSGLDSNQIFGPEMPPDVNEYIPLQIYQSSLCSLVFTDYNSCMVGDKISKCLLIGRPFVVIGPQGYLQNLHEIGFETFDPVIDESYDQEPDPIRRWNLAMDALGKLATQNPQSVYDRLKKRLKHNRKMSYNSEYWINRLKNWLNETINEHTGTPCAIS